MSEEIGDVIAPETLLAEAIEVRADEIACAEIASADAARVEALAHAEHTEQHAAAVVADAIERIEQTEEQARWQSIHSELSQLREQNHQLQTLLETQARMMETFSAPLLQLVTILREEVAATSKKSTPRASAEVGLNPSELTPDPASEDPKPEPSVKRSKPRLI
jgi:endonuclease/exonuclease/phosphatase (EEP) superfamily protein YafD